MIIGWQWHHWQPLQPSIEQVVERKTGTLGYNIGVGNDMEIIIVEHVDAQGAFIVQP